MHISSKVNMPWAQSCCSSPSTKVAPSTNILEKKKDRVVQNINNSNVQMLKADVKTERTKEQNEEQSGSALSQNRGRHPR